MITGIPSENPLADRRKFVKVGSSEAASFWPVHPRMFLGQSEDHDNAHLGQTMETRFSHRTFQIRFDFSRRIVENECSAEE